MSENIPNDDYSSPDEIELDDNVKSEDVSDIEILRNHITMQAGEVDSRQGKAWDLQEVLLLMIIDVFTKINTSNSIEDIKKSTSDYIPLFTSIQGKIMSGDIQLVHQTKGLTSTDVIDEVVVSMNEISNVFKAAIESAKEETESES